MKLQDYKHLSDTLVFTMGMTQLYSAVDSLGLDVFNALSPFKPHLSSKEPLSDDMKVLMADKDFIKMVKHLATPDKRLSLKSYSDLDGHHASTVFIKEGVSELGALWVQKDANQQLVVLAFKTAQEWLKYFVLSRGYDVDAPPRQGLSQPLNKEGLVLLMNALDAYKHAYLYEQLNYRPMMGNQLHEADFVSILQAGVKANDMRWLVPCALHLAHWSKPSEVEFTVDGIEPLIESSVLQPSINPENGEKSFLLGAEGVYMGLEFAVYKKEVAAMTLEDLSGTQLNWFLGLTHEAIHSFDLANEQAIHHTVYDDQAFVQTLLKALQA